MNKLLIMGGFLLAILTIEAQSNAQKQHVGIYVGVGPSLYYNNFNQRQEYVNPFQYSTSLKLLWEPEHQLSLGIHTGFKKIYSVNVERDTTRAYTDLYAIPMQLCISMKIYRGIYASCSLGPSLLSSRINVPGIQDINTSLLSFADITTSIGYKYPLGNKVSFGAEVEYFHSSRSFENTFSFLVMMGYAIK